MCGKRDGVRAGSVFVTYVPGNFIKNSAPLRIYNQGLFEKAPPRHRGKAARLVLDIRNGGMSER